MASPAASEHSAATHLPGQVMVLAQDSMLEERRREGGRRDLLDRSSSKLTREEREGGNGKTLVVHVS